METLVTIFIGISALAIVIQMGVLIAMYASMKKTSTRVNAIADVVEQKGLPVIEAANHLLVENGPKITTIVDNAVATTTTARAQIQRLDTTVSDIIDRTRLQVIRADELVSRTMDKVEETTDLVHHSVISPVRYVAGLISGVTATANTLFGLRRRNRPPRNGGRDEEMFI